MDSDQQVHVCRDHAHFEHVRPFLPCDATEKAAEEPRQAGIDHRFTVASRPDQVAIQAVDQST